MVEALLTWLAQVPTPIQYATLMLLSALENIFPPVPADVAVALGAFLSLRGETSAVAIGVSCWAANTASAALTYFLGRRYGESLLRRRWARRLLPPETVLAVRDAYARHGSLGIFVSRFLPGVRAAVTPVAGVFGLSAGRALVPAAAASALWYGLIVGAGTSLGLSWDGVRKLLDQANLGLTFAALVALVAAILWLQRRRGGPPPPPAR